MSDLSFPPSRTSRGCSGIRDLASHLERLRDMVMDLSVPSGFRGPVQEDMDTISVTAHRMGVTARQLARMAFQSPTDLQERAVGRAVTDLMAVSGRFASLAENPALHGYAQKLEEVSEGSRILAREAEEVLVRIADFRRAHAEYGFAFPDTLSEPGATLPETRA
ncbi:MAG: hypothetical protein M3O22_04300 [Pseudomonadota bacterium]|nr:hypothetical protein [Pseudomonadota bacterium]